MIAGKTGDGSNITLFHSPSLFLFLYLSLSPPFLSLSPYINEKYLYVCVCVGGIYQQVQFLSKEVWIHSFPSPRLVAICMYQPLRMSRIEHKVNF